MNEEQEKQLYRLVELGCNRSVSTLVESHLGLVVFVAKKYKCRAFTFEEILSEGTIGLTTAIKKFNYRSGNKLSTYAIWWIKQSISNAIIWKSRTVRLPAHIVLKSRKYIKELAELEKNGKYEDKKNLKYYKAYKYTDIEESLNEEDEEELCRLDIVEAEKDNFIDDNFNNEMLSKLPFILDKLKPRYKDVIKKRYGIGCKQMTLEELGIQMNITRERVRQLQTAATKKLREEILKLI